ncbi:pheST operon leader peptide PheM [Serratia marcescens]|nr:pheST operon leader peptide PheM [Serratia marcescens]
MHAALFRFFFYFRA